MRERIIWEPASPAEQAAYEQHAAFVAANPNRVAEHRESAKLRHALFETQQAQRVMRHERIMALFDAALEQERIVALIRRASTLSALKDTLAAALSDLTASCFPVRRRAGRPRGRPTGVSHEDALATAREIRALMSRGVARAVAAQRNGIADSTARRWLRWLDENEQTTGNSG